MPARGKHSRLALFALLLAGTTHAGVFTLIQGAADVAPSAPPPFAHWDLRRFTDCEVPYAVGRTPAGLAAAAAITGVDNAFGVWQGVEPAVIRFRNVGAAPANTSANDGNNTVFWDNNLCNGDAWDAGLIGGAIGITAARMNAATGIYPDVDIVLDDAHFTWTNGTQAFPGGDDQYATEIVPGGNRRTVITTGANGICESIALCGDIQVVAVGANGGANAVGVRTGNAATLPPAPPAPLIGSIRNFRGQMDVWNIMAHECGHFCGLGENNGANTGSEVNESFNNGPFNIPGGTTLSFTINGNAVNAALTAGAGRTAAQIAADINAAIGAQQPGQGNAIANPVGSVEIRATVAGQPVIVTGDAAAVAALGFLTGESGMSTMNQTDPRGLNSLDQRTLSRHDTDGLNFLYTPDLGDAPDPAAGPQGRYQTLVHGPAGAQTLNGVALLNAGVGAEHLFGHAPNRYEWLGLKEDGSNQECEARVADLDDFDDGLGIAGGRILVTDSARVTVLVNANDPGGRYLDVGARRLYFNGYFDFNNNRLFEAAERAIFWSGVPGATTAASANFYPSLSDLTVNPMVLTFKVLAPDPGTQLTDSTWVRARLDYGENEGRVANINGDLGPAVGVAQFGEVEDKRFSTFKRTVAMTCPNPGDGDHLHVVFQQFCAENLEPVPANVFYQVADKLGWITNSDLPLTGGSFFLPPVGTQCVNIQVTPPQGTAAGVIDTVCFVIYAPETNQRDTCCTTVTCTSPTATRVARFDAQPEAGSVELDWELGDSRGVTGFLVYRSEASVGEVRVTPEAIPVTSERRYSFVDRTVSPGATYDYVLSLLAPGGAENRVASLAVVVPRATFALGRPSPNPTDAGFSLRLGTPRAGFAKVRLYDVSGRLVITLFEGLLTPGERTITWDGRLAGGARARNGLYFVVYEAVGRKATERVMIVR